MSKEQIEEMARIICQDSSNRGNCEKCGFYRAYKCYKFEEAERLYKAGYRKQSEGEWYVNYMMSKKPSKRGRTIQYTTYTCSVCGKPNGRKKSKFCPNCGRKMKGGAE